MGSYGSDKPLAYQGLRPRILDYLLIAHQVACSWPTASAKDRLKLGYLADNATKEFVSTAQKEVGRDRTAFSGAAKEGTSIELSDLLPGVNDEMLRKGEWI